MIDLEHVTEIAIRAAREAGEIALRGFRSAGLETRIKRDLHDTVTAYDGACERRIRDIILSEFADATIIGEEDGRQEGAGVLTWFVDPIDGTSNFARGIALWAVSIGVALRDEMIAGVIFDPVSGQLFWADHRGAFLQHTSRGGRDGSLSADEVDQPLNSTGYTDPGEATVALNFPLARDLVHRSELALEQYAAVTRSFAQVRGLGSTCIALAWIAAGWLDATISFETNSWDIAAGAFIIVQAGGIFRGYTETGTVLSAGQAHHGAHYYAAVAGGEFALLQDIMHTQSPRGLAE